MILQADARRIPLRDGCVQTVVTSPPYWGLRDYGTARWEGGDEDCDHSVGGQVRVTEDTPEYAAFKASKPRGVRSSDLETYGLTRGTSNPSVTKQTSTTGWRPSCSHDAPSVPCLVLDPFLGSGTVGKVAERFGRRWVGLELSADYIGIAEKRTAQLGIMFGAQA